MLYTRLLKASVRFAAMGETDGFAPLSDDLRDSTALADLWRDELHWSHRSPLLIAHALLDAERRGELPLHDDFADKLLDLQRAGQRRNDLLRQEYDAITAALDLPVIPLKGLWMVAEGVYPAAARLFGDLDIALPRDTDRRALIRKLEARGYVFDPVSGDNHLAFKRTAPGMGLYAGLPILREPMPNMDDHIRRVNETFFLDAHFNLDVPGALNRPFLFGERDRHAGERHLLLLCYHLWRHDYAHAYGVVDIALLMRSPLIDTARFVALTDEFNAQSLCAGAFGIAARCFREDLLPTRWKSLQSDPAFGFGWEFGERAVLDAYPSWESRRLAAKIDGSFAAHYRLGVEFIREAVPYDFPLRTLVRDAIRARSIRRNERLRDDD
ncbi:MAG: nucleotidyltransferase family protein [Candidatus Poribacteria bacterium]|nr:nucleotidyltransferase family protein [Candidatus Poribacteria bacterium]